jgi:NitT/TauT family transport system substrate-binding protein
MVKSILAALAIWMAATSTGFAQEKLKIAIPQRGFWDSSWVEFGQAAGFFKEAGLDVEIFWTDGGAQTLTAALSGSVDIALSNGFLGVIGAYVKGAPIKVISAEMTGATELFWWVKSDSPYKTLADVPDGKTVAFSSPGSSSNLILLGLLRQTGSKAKPVATGGVPGTTTQVMTGQIDVGWSVVPLGLPEIQEGTRRIVARSKDLVEMRNQTIRVNIVNAEILKTKRAAITKFMEVYAKSIDWAYSNPQAIEMFAKNMKVPFAVAKQGVDEYYPKSAMQMGEIREIERTLKEALDYKFIPSAKTPKDVEGMIDIVYKPAK